MFNITTFGAEVMKKQDGNLQLKYCAFTVLSCTLAGLE